MKTILNVNGTSQFDDSIKKSLQSSACGPVTAFVMMQHLLPNSFSHSVNDLYRILGGTKIGLFKRRFIHNMQKTLGPKWHVAACTIEDVKREINDGRLVAAKFDKWFAFRWRGDYDFDYHWVPIIGFEQRGNDVILAIHDNGGRDRESRIRHISFNRNQKVLSFVKIRPAES
ncbi:hypothetical protein FITA111629_09750 [Filibacter tadaridae]|uniref:Peptidase C39-like domain-containing protein n=1 Tax=Filibacter tadaridae TaxID=2483811 RepID=A0A3P5XV86_9BACL|nr:hypothetical protein [Filibacter tadaridae]VDC32004.1 hypothetical protein FILTAD_02551 [Filibacter tadaridae]